MDRFYNTKEKVSLAILFFAALVSLFFFINFRTLAFPEHTIKFDVTREQAAQKAKAFISSQGIATKDYKETTVFSIDEMAKTYLEREVGVSETARLAAGEVDVWHFTTRLFKPLEQEEITVSYLPNGKLVSYAHEIANTDKGARLNQDDARKVAETFLTDTVKLDLSEWKIVSREVKQQKNRIDHLLIWEKQNFKAKDATYRITLQLYGDKVGNYKEALKIPQEWERAYYKDTSNNDLAQTIAEVAMFLLFGIAIVITFLLEYRRNNLRLGSLKIVAWVAALIAILASLNALPLSLSMYETTISWEGFIGSIILISLLGGMFEGSSVLLVLAAGEAKFRAMYPQNVSLESLFRQGIFTKSANKALFVGTFAGIIFFTYELVYYFLGSSIGFWAPAAINYSDVYSTLLPWIYPMFIGFLAAASEEGMFRLFGIPFLKKYVKSTWVAIFITAIVWGFLHSNYPQSPWFVRGIEISIMGVVLGWMFVRFGILSTFVAHYTFNALQTAIAFYQSGNLYVNISSTIVALLPLLIGVIVLVVSLSRKGFAPEHTTLLNSKVKPEKISESPQITKMLQTGYEALSRKRKRIMIGLSVVSLVAIFGVSAQTPSEEIPTSISRQDVLKIADQELANRSVAAESYTRVATFSPQDIATEEKYILEVADYKTLQSVFPEKLPLATWSVRYFKPLQKESYEVTVLPEGKILQVVHELDETAAGAKLTSQQARTIVEDYLRREKGYNVTDYKLVESKVEQQKKRNDHLFVYQDLSNNVGDAVYQTEIAVTGNEVSGVRSYLKLPDAWVREQNEVTTKDFVVFALITFIGFAFAWVGFRTFFSLLQQKKLQFKQAFKLAGFVTIISLISTINSLTLFYSNYDTSVPLQTYIVQSILVSILSFVTSFLITATFIAVFIQFWREQVGKLLPESKQRSVYIRDAVLVGYCVPILLFGVSSMVMTVLLNNDLMRSIPTFDAFPQLDTFIPAIAVLGELPLALGSISLSAILLLLLKQLFKTWKKVFIVLAIIAALLAMPQQKTLEDSAISLMQNIFILSVGSILIGTILRRNLLAYFVVLFVSMLATSGLSLFLQPDLFYKLNGACLLLLALLPAVLYFFPKLLLEFKFGRMVQ